MLDSWLEPSLADKGLGGLAAEGVTVIEVGVGEPFLYLGFYIVQFVL